MNIEVTPFAAGLGADVLGIDMRSPQTLGTQTALRQAWSDHLVLRFREQPMTDEQHMRLPKISASLNAPPMSCLPVIRA